MAKVTFPDGSTRNVTPTTKLNDLQDYLNQSRAAGRNIDFNAEASAFDELAGAGPATSYQPGGGNAFFAGLEELFNSPGDFANDAASSATLGVLPSSATFVPTSPGGGNSFLAGLEELAQKPGQFVSDLVPSLPGSATVLIGLGLVVAGIFGVAYIAHKAL